MSEQVSITGEECRNLSNAWKHKEVVNYKFSVKYLVTVLSNFRNGGVRQRVSRSNLMETKSQSWEARVMSHYDTFKLPTYSHLYIHSLSIKFSSVQSLSNV